ncbi:T-cell surface glycoprotein CD5 [Myotis brandtii]|uniref:T-cell surface glycoprotein CD5 n=1 Tax=Myotis brandtii TaxID=109478 RepID=S7MSP8_MYOBR|nr:T-cell surface glycoprotein CD5 [Myotis brandtii]
MKCREALLLGQVPSFSSPRNHITCQGMLGSFSHCNASDARQAEPLSLICLAPPHPLFPPPRTFSLRDPLPLHHQVSHCRTTEDDPSSHKASAHNHSRARSSYQVLEAGEKDTRGLVCFGEKLSQCHQLQERRAHCKRVFLTCQDPNPAGLGTGTVMSIILALVLLAVLLVMCGPLIYKKLVKKCSWWVSPAVASFLPAALEGALRRVSAQPDNSSDSDYDLHGAQRL